MGNDKRRRIETRLIHEGEPSPRILGAVAMPIFQTAMFELAGESDYHDLKYIRLNNTPNHVALANKLAALEEAEAALVAASGMAAISTTLLALLEKGDHLIAQRGLYGGTHDFVVKDLPQLGIEATLVDAADPATWEAARRPGTKVFYVETLSNPTLQMGDLPAVVAFAKQHGMLAIVDNTFATPINFCPAEHGFDLSLHSGTKYLNGHSDIVAGAVIGRGELIARVKRKLDHLGGSLDPHAAFLLHRGMKTLAVRVKHQNETALTLARALERHPAVSRVNHPGLERHPSHKRARALLRGFGGMLSFELKGGSEAAARFLSRTTIPIKAPSLGGVESLLTLPARTSHAGLTPEERQAAGIGDALIRMSVGLEAAEDLLDDLLSALG